MSYSILKKVIRKGDGFDAAVIALNLATKLGFSHMHSHATHLCVQIGRSYQPVEKWRFIPERPGRQTPLPRLLNHNSTLPTTALRRLFRSKFGRRLLACIFFGGCYAACCSLWADSS